MEGSICSRSRRRCIIFIAATGTHEEDFGATEDQVVMEACHEQIYLAAGVRHLHQPRAFSYNRQPRSSLTVDGDRTFLCLFFGCQCLFFPSPLFVLHLRSILLFGFRIIFPHALCFP